MLAGRYTTSPIRLNIHVTSAEVSGSRGGVERAMTVMLSRMPLAVLGIARTMVHSSAGSEGPL